MRRFYVQAGEATVAEGVQLSDGTCAVLLRETPAHGAFHALYPSLEHAEAHLCADGTAQVVLLDGEGET